MWPAPNIFPILGGFFVNNVVCQSNHFSRLTTKQNVMKKAKYLIFNRLGNTEKQHLPRIGSLFIQISKTYPKLTILCCQM